ncbi:hypothetical protein FRC11_000545 [Ceratobasidium sp. 423]|nr:hypothetical protein FRC11_000545 [Ceratobasidium sp. 423]
MSGMIGVRALGDGERSPRAANTSPRISHTLHLVKSTNRRRTGVLDVSRQLLVTIQESPELQYLLELDILGFVTPLNPLDTLSLGDKIRILQEKRIASADEKRRDIGIRTVKFESIGPLSANIQYSRGVLAVGKPSIDVTRQLQLYQLASGNKHTEHSSFILQDMGVVAHDFRFDPDLDLLVLLERVTDPNTDLELRLHLRSLSTGLTHPLASTPTLMSTFKFTTTYSETGFQIVGNSLAILCFTNSRLDTSSPRMCVWDWTTGELITSTEVPGTDFAFISEDTFLVPVGRRKWAGYDTIGSLLVYSTANTHPGGRAQHVASLRLPPTTTGPCHSQCQFITTTPPPAPIIVNGCLKITTPKRIYEVGSSSHYLCLRIKAFNIENMHSDMANGLLFIRSSNIHQVLNKMTSQSQSPAHISWEDWGRGASWINTRRLRSSPNCIFGHRVALLSFDHENRGWRAFLYDLRTNMRSPTTRRLPEGSLEELRPADAYLNGIFINPELGIHGPTVATSFLVSEGEEWNEHTDSIPPELAIDDERRFFPPLTPLDDVSLREKILILREKHFITTDGTQRNDGVHKTSFKVTQPLGSTIQYSQGVLAIGGLSTDLTRQLHFYQLASRNKHTGHSSWELHDKGVDAEDFRLEPDLDLLVLVERAHPQADTNLRIKFHLRSLSTGLKHPLASIPVLTNTLKFTAYSENGFQIIGQLLAIICFTTRRSDVPSQMYIWNWTTGELITSVAVRGSTFAFVSEDVFLVEVSRSKRPKSGAIGTLDVHTIADIPSGGRPRHVASLHLPPVMQGRCNSLFHFIRTPFPLTSLVNGHLEIVTPKRVYDIGPKFYYLCLRIQAHDIEGMPYQMSKGLLFIPYWVILESLEGLETHSHSGPPEPIPWEDWARCTSWVNMPKLRWGSHNVFGHRAAFFWFDRKEDGWRTLVLDLRANAPGPTTGEWLRDRHEELCPSDAYLNSIFLKCDIGAREPAIVSSFLLSEDEVWRTDSNFPPELIIDDEHIITYDVEPTGINVTDRQI